MDRIPLQLNSDNYSIEVLLGEVEYLIQFKYNGRADAWFFDVLAIDGTPLRMGVPLVLDSDLFAGWNEVERPDGIVVAFTLGTPTDPPTRDDVRRGLVDMFFIPTSELPEPSNEVVENPGPVFLEA